MDADAEKANALVTLGWWALVFTTSMLRKDAEGCVGAVREMLGRTSPDRM